MLRNKLVMTLSLKNLHFNTVIGIRACNWKVVGSSLLHGSILKGLHFVIIYREKNKGRAKQFLYMLANLAIIKISPKCKCTNIFKTV